MRQAFVAGCAGCHEQAYALARVVVTLVLLTVLPSPCPLTPVFGDAASTARASSNDTAWMSRAKFGVFMHYQYRILLGYSIATKPSFPKPSEMTAEGWNNFVDGFDVDGGVGHPQSPSSPGVSPGDPCTQYWGWPCRARP